MNITLHVCFLILFFSINSIAQVKKDDLGENPIYFLDSARTDFGEMKNVNPNNVILVTVFSRAEGLKRFGGEGKDGIVYVETVNFVKQRSWRYLKTKVANNNNEESIKLIDDISFKNFQFILNGVVLKDIDAHLLTNVNDKNLKQIAFIDGNQLSKKYGVTSKDYGLVVTAKIKKKKKPKSS